MKGFIVEDEQNSTQALIELLNLYCPFVEITGYAKSVEEAFNKLNNATIDVVFLDIELADSTGFDLLNRLGSYDFQVIFTTAFDQYAIKAFKYSSLDYLLKPIDPDDLVAALQKVKALQTSNSFSLKIKTLLENLNKSVLQERKLIISDKESINAILLKDIYYFQASGAYTIIMAKGHKFVSSKNLKNYDDLLQDIGFIRTHHSFLANIAQIVKYDRYESILHLSDGHQVPVSNRKKEDLLSKIKDLSVI